MVEMDELARSLAAERRVLELLLFKLVEAQHLLAEGDDRFYALASAELERVLQLARDAELKRALVIGPDRTLTDLAVTAPSPFGTILDDHRDSMRALLAEIEAVSRASCELSRTDTGAAPALTGNTCDLSLASLAEFLA
jgi:hypothetical protein